MKVASVFSVIFLLLSTIAVHGLAREVNHQKAATSISKDEVVRPDDIKCYETAPIYHGDCER
ncbi:hypothetical protein LINPERPRIM_LOCUS39973, partial [Linum perenne]